MHFATSTMLDVVRLLLKAMVRSQLFHCTVWKNHGNLWLVMRKSSRNHFQAIFPPKTDQLWILGDWLKSLPQFGDSRSLWIITSKVIMGTVIFSPGLSAGSCLSRAYGKTENMSHFSRPLRTRLVSQCLCPANILQATFSVLKILITQTLWMPVILSLVIWWKHLEYHAVAWYSKALRLTMPMSNWFLSTAATFIVSH